MSNKLYNKAKKVLKQMKYNRKVNKLFDGAAKYERNKKKR